MNTANIIANYISEELLNGHSTITVEDDLLGDNLVDSIGIMSLIAFMEEEFVIKVPLEDITIENFRTVENIDAYLQKVKVK